MHPLRLLVIGVVGVAISLYFRAADRQLLRKPRARKWEPPGEIGVWKLMLPTSVVLALVGAIALIADAVS